MSFASLSALRAELAVEDLVAAPTYRVLFVGRSPEGFADATASLHRGLEGAGHTVFVLDVAALPDVLRDGGDGSPGELNVDALSEVLDRFAPTVVITCGKQLSPGRHGVAKLRERGIASIRLLLPGERWDFDCKPELHCCDLLVVSELADQRLGENYGLRNLAYLAPAVDRSLVLREVPQALRLPPADVLLLDRPIASGDVDRALEALSSQIDVRDATALGSSRGLSARLGDERLGALQSCSIYLSLETDFTGERDLTRVELEALAAGAVLCVPSRESLGRQLTPGLECITYESVDRIPELLLVAWKQRDQIEAMRCRSLQRLIRDHLYERSWKTVFSRLEEVLRANGHHIATSGMAPRHVMISGFYGAGNLGDDLLLEVVAGAVRERVPGGNPVVAAAAARKVVLDQGFQAFDRSSGDTGAFWSSRCTSMVLGPGGIWHDYSIVDGGGVAGILRGALVSPAHFGQLPLLTRLNGGAVHVAGVGVGPLNHPEARALVGLTAAMSESVTVRDEASKALLLSIDGYEGNVEVHPDFVYALDLSDVVPASGAGRPYLAVNVRPWAQDENATLRVARAAAALADELDLDVIGVPMCSEDESELRRRFAEVGLSESVILPFSTPRKKILGVLAGARTLVAMRLHANILAHRFGTPCVGVAYDPKIPNHFKEIGRPERSLGIGAADNDIQARARVALAEGMTRDDRLRIGRLESGAASALERLVERIATARPTDPRRHPLRGQPWLTSNAAAPAAPQKVDLTEGTFTSGNALDPAAQVDVRAAKIGTRATFNLLSRAPRRGDFASFRIPVRLQRGQRVAIGGFVHIGYRSAPSMTGRLAIEGFVDGKVVLRADVASACSRCEFEAVLEPQNDNVQVEIRLVALRDCEDWNWGPAVPVSVTGLEMRPTWRPVGRRAFPQNLAT